MATPHPFPGRIVGVSSRVDVEGPASFLRRMTGGPRGFWARGSRWVAHGGVVAQVEVGSSGPEREGSGPISDRFERVRQAAGPLLHAVDHVGEARMYGGFAFRDDHRPVGIWEDFPGARFVLPEVELVSGERGMRLVLRRSLEPEEDPAVVEGEMRRRLAELRAGLEAESRRRAQGSNGASAPGAGRDRSTSPETVPIPGDLPSAGATHNGAEWNRAVDRALAAIGSGALSKVVLARSRDLALPASTDPVEVVLALWREYPTTHVFLFEPRPGSALVGAPPETVVTLDEGVFEATAVAGSAPRGESDGDAERLAHALLRSPKDRAEHRFAVDDMVERLREHARSVDVASEPRILRLARIQHLETPIYAEIREEENVLSLLAALHPTPAVCGLPREAAFDFVAAEEDFDRGWYSGPVGWFDVHGNGVFAPALRCALGREGKWRLFAGAGIVEGSVPTSEWEETEMKFVPMMRALGLGR